jgi:hypothetical protein
LELFCFYPPTACTFNKYGLLCANTCNCSVNAIECNAVSGCVCRAGYSGIDCSIDINECSRNLCPLNSVCKNVPGSYSCLCNPGFSTTSSFSFWPENSMSTFFFSFFLFCFEVNASSSVQECQDINECLQQPSACNFSQDCTNTIGSYDCTCKTGFIATGQNNTCANINECVATPGICGQNASCVDTIGSFKCTCNFNYLEVNNSCVYQERCMTDIFIVFFFILNSYCYYFLISLF